MPLNGNPSVVQILSRILGKTVPLLGALGAHAGNGNDKSERQREQNRVWKQARGGDKEDTELFKAEPEKQDCLDNISKKKITWDTPREGTQRCLATLSV